MTLARCLDRHCGAAPSVTRFSAVVSAPPSTRMARPAADGIDRCPMWLYRESAVNAGPRQLRRRRSLPPVAPGWPAHGITRWASAARTLRACLDDRDSPGRPSGPGRQLLGGP